MEKVIYVIIAVVLMRLVWLIFSVRFTVGQYLYEDNPYKRTCRLCGSRQNLFEDGSGSYWGQVYPLGNDPSCPCHRDVR